MISKNTISVPRWIPVVFYIATAYDGLLGILGLLAPVTIFTKFDAALPGHMGYINFIALLLILVSIMFFNIAKDPIANRNLIFYSILAKTAYCIVVFGYLFFGNIPAMFVPFAYLDLIFVALFVLAGRSISSLLWK